MNPQRLQGWPGKEGSDPSRACVVAALSGCAPHKIPVGDMLWVLDSMGQPSSSSSFFLSLLLLQARLSGAGRVGSRAGRTGRVRGTHPVTPPGRGPSSRPVCQALICLSLLSGPAPALLEPRPYHPTQETHPGSWVWGSFRVAPFQSVISHLSAAGSAQTAPHPLPPHPRRPGLDPGSDTGINSSLRLKT